RAPATGRCLVYGSATAAALRRDDEDGEQDVVQLVGRFRPARSEEAFAEDLRALGGVLFHLLSGTAPAGGRAPAIREANPSAQVSFATERLAQRLLDGELQSAREALRALDEAGARAALEIARGSAPRPV